MTTQICPRNITRVLAEAELGRPEDFIQIFFNKEMSTIIYIVKLFYVFIPMYIF